MYLSEILLFWILISLSLPFKIFQISVSKYLLYYFLCCCYCQINALGDFLISL